MRQYRISQWNKGVRTPVLIQASSVRVAMSRFMEHLAGTDQLPTPAAGMINSLDIEYEDLGQVVEIGIVAYKEEINRYYYEGEETSAIEASVWYTHFVDTTWHPKNSPAPEGYVVITRNNGHYLRMQHIQDLIESGDWERVDNFKDYRPYLKRTEQGLTKEAPNV